MKNYWDIDNSNKMSLKSDDKQPTFVDEPDSSKFFLDSNNVKSQNLNRLDQVYGGPNSTSPLRGTSLLNNNAGKSNPPETKTTSVVPAIGSTESYRDSVLNTINLYPVTMKDDKQNSMIPSELRQSYDQLRTSRDLMPKAQRAEPIQSYYRIKATVNQALNLELKPRLRCLVGNNAGESIPLTTTVN